jgi:hypothetical protein
MAVQINPILELILKKKIVKFYYEKSYFLISEVQLFLDLCSEQEEVLEGHHQVIQCKHFQTVKQMRNYGDCCYISKVQESLQRCNK